MRSDLPTKRRVRWWLVLALSALFGCVGLLAALLTVNASMGAVSNETGEMTVSVFGVTLHQERGPWKPLEEKMFSYGWTLFGGYAAVGILLGAGIGAIFRRSVTTSQSPAPNPPKP